MPPDASRTGKTADVSPPTVFSYFSPSLVSDKWYGPRLETTTRRNGTGSGVVIGPPRQSLCNQWLDFALENLLPCIFLAHTPLETLFHVFVCPIPHAVRYLVRCFIRGDDIDHLGAD